jgi:hypothetical protein
MKVNVWSNAHNKRLQPIGNRCAVSRFGRSGCQRLKRRPFCGFQRRKMEPLEMIVYVAENRDPKKATFDNLAEEVMELHLAMRGKHPDTPAMEWLEIATIAMNAFSFSPAAEQIRAYDDWVSRHGPAAEQRRAADVARSANVE